MMTYPPCPKKYVQDGRLPAWRLNAIPVKQVSHMLTSEGAEFGPFDFWQLYFPRPWIIVGLVDLSQMPDTNPGYPNSYCAPITPAKHNTYKSLPGGVFIDLALANSMVYDPSSAVNYVRPGVQAFDYRGYFSKYLNDKALETKEEEYNSLIQPESVMRQFFNLNAASTAIEWTKAWNETIKFLEKTMDKNLMGAPGVYEIIVSESPTWGGIPSWVGETDYQQFLNA